MRNMKFMSVSLTVTVRVTEAGEKFDQSDASRPSRGLTVTVTPLVVGIEISLSMDREHEISGALNLQSMW
jgi:hypothetical protein